MIFPLMLMDLPAYGENLERERERERFAGIKCSAESTDRIYGLNIMLYRLIFYAFFCFDLSDFVCLNLRVQKRCGGKRRRPYSSSLPYTKRGALLHCNLGSTNV